MIYGLSFGNKSIRLPLVIGFIILVFIGLAMALVIKG